LEVLLEAYRKHETWVDIVKSFGCNPDTAEDIVQEMYIRLNRLSNNGLNITYKNELNYYYIYKILKTMFLDLKKKEKKIMYIDNPQEYINQLEDNMDVNVSYDDLYQKIMSVLNELYWYDRKVFELLDGEISISELSRNTGITYASLYNTYRKVKQILKNKLL